MIRFFLHLYVVLLFVDAILSFFPVARKNSWAMHIKKLADFTLNPIRKLLPPNLPVDPSPLIFLLAVELIIVLW